MTVRWWESRWFVAAALLLAALPLLWPVVPPLTDLPGHIGRYRVMLGDEAALLDHYYSFEWRLVGNLGVDLLVAALAPLIGLEPAVKLVVLAIPVLTTGALLWLSCELTGRVSPWALFALPLAFSYPFQFGFVNYCLAMALALGGWALWLRLGRLQRIGLRAAIFVPFGLVVWTCHAMGWAMLGLFVFAGEWAARARDRSVVRAAFDAGIAALPLAPPVLAMLVWRGGGAPADTGRFFDLVAKLKGLGSVLRDRWMWLDLPALLVIVVAVYAGIRGQAGRFAREAAAAAGLTMLAFLLLPFTLLGSAYADLRLLPFAFAVALAGLVPREGAPSAPSRWRALPFSCSARWPRLQVLRSTMPIGGGSWSRSIICRAARACSRWSVTAAISPGRMAAARIFPPLPPRVAPPLPMINGGWRARRCCV